MCYCMSPWDRNKPDVRTLKSVFTPLFSIRDFIQTGLKMERNKGSYNMDGPSEMELDNRQTEFKVFAYIKHTLKWLMTIMLTTGDISYTELYVLLSRAESNMNDLVSEYQQYQEATIDDDYDGDGEDLEQDEA